MKKQIFRLLLLMPYLYITGGYAQAPALPFILQDEQKLAAFRQQYKGNSPAMVKAVDSLVYAADQIIKAGQSYSVTFQKTRNAPRGDKHDYISQAPYWWPDSSKADGKPYIRKDGRINPERNESKDYGQMGKLTSEIKQLSLAYYFSGNEQYAKKTVELIKVWFIDTATRMNPNLDFGQYIPGITDGRGIGIIETVGLTNIPDALAMMQQSRLATAVFIRAVKQWFIQYIDWLINSKNGKDERSQINNHGTYYDMQLADFALFVGNKGLAKKVIEEQTIPRIDQQFTVDGAQPLELIRTKSWGYATMNLVGWCKLAVIAERINIDLWHKQTLDGKGINRALEWFLPYLLKQKEWKYEQIEPITYNSVLTLYNLTASKYPASSFKQAVTRYAEMHEDLPWW